MWSKMKIHIHHIISTTESQQIYKKKLCVGKKKCTRRNQTKILTVIFLGLGELN